MPLRYSLEPSVFVLNRLPTSIPAIARVTLVTPIIMIARGMDNFLVPILNPTIGYLCLLLGQRAIAVQLPLSQQLPHGHLFF